MKFYQFETTEEGSAGNGVRLRTGKRSALRQGTVAALWLVVLAIAATAQTQIDLRTQVRNVDFSVASTTKPSKTGTTLPAFCGVGETFLKTDASAGKNLYVCTQANTWIVQGTPDTTGNADKVLSNDGTSAGWRAIGGDVSGKPDAIAVTKIQGRAVATTAPSNGQALVWNSAVSQWQPQTQSGQSGQSGGVASIFGRTGAVAAQSGDYSFGQISGTVTDSQVTAGISANKIGNGTVGNAALGFLANVTSDLQTQLSGKASTSQPVGGDVSGVLGAVTVAALQGRAVAATLPTNGQSLVWNSSLSQWQPQSVTSVVPGGAYSSSFASQTTVIIPGATHQLGTANLLVGCYDTSVPANRVQPNSVSIHPTLFDVTITFAVAQSGRCVVSSGGGGSSGGSGGGASMATQLGDFNVTLTTPTVLTIGQNCSPATPCNVRWGSRVFTFTASATVTLSSGTGTAYFYIDSNGMLTAGHNLTLTCASPCSAMAGVTAFPLSSIPLFTWTSTASTWDTAGGLDKRAFLSARTLNAGTGIVTLDTSSNTSIAVDSAAVPTYLTASATLTFGSIANGSCADTTFPLTGAAVGNAVAPGLPSGLEAGLIANLRVSAANTIGVRLCNLSGGAISPASATYTGTIVRSF